MRERKGTTLTEVVIGAALASVIMISVWGLFSLSHKMFHSTRKRLVSLQGAFLLLERFNMDLSSIIVSPDSETSVSADNKAFSFSYYDADESDLESQSPKMVLRTMEYSYDEESANFLRKDGHSSVRAFRDAQFEVILYAIPEKQSPLRPSDEHVTFRITCAASDDIEVNRGKKDQDADRRDKQVVTLISTAGFTQRASEVAFPWWVPNKYPQIDN
jgi:hypothetical protein